MSPLNDTKHLLNHRVEQNNQSASPIGNTIRGQKRLIQPAKNRNPLLNRQKTRLAQRLLMSMRGMSPFIQQPSKESIMNIRHTKLIALTIAGFLATCAGLPAYSADQYGAPADMARPANGRADPISDGCAKLDTNHDGFVSMKEFVKSGRPIQEFKIADASKSGKLSMAECTRALAAPHP